MGRSKPKFPIQCSDASVRCSSEQQQQQQQQPDGNNDKKQSSTWTTERAGNLPPPSRRKERFLARRQQKRRDRLGREEQDEEQDELGRRKQQHQQGGGEVLGRLALAWDPTNSMRKFAFLPPPVTDDAASANDKERRQDDDETNPNVKTHHPAPQSPPPITRGKLRQRPTPTEEEDNDVMNDDTIPTTSRNHKRGRRTRNVIFDDEDEDDNPQPKRPTNDSVDGKTSVTIESDSNPTTSDSGKFQNRRGGGRKRSRPSSPSKTAKVKTSETTSISSVHSHMSSYLDTKSVTTTADPSEDEVVVLMNTKLRKPVELSFAHQPQGGEGDGTQVVPSSPAPTTPNHLGTMQQSKGHGIPCFSCENGSCRMNSIQYIPTRGEETAPEDEVTTKKEAGATQKRQQSDAQDDHGDSFTATPPSSFCIGEIILSRYFLNHGGIEESAHASHGGGIFHAETSFDTHQNHCHPQQQQDIADSSVMLQAGKSVLFLRDQVLLEGIPQSSPPKQKGNSDNNDPLSPSQEQSAVCDDENKNNENNSPSKRKRRRMKKPTSNNIEGRSNVKQPSSPEKTSESEFGMMMKHLALCVELGYMVVQLRRRTVSEQESSFSSAVIDPVAPDVPIKETENSNSSYWGNAGASSGDDAVRQSASSACCCCCCWVLQVFLLPKAVRQCHANVLPLQRVSRAPKYQHAEWIQQVLLYFLMNQQSMLSGTSKDQQQSSQSSMNSITNTVTSERPSMKLHSPPTTMVTAKDIYEWTDNVQLEHALLKQMEQLKRRTDTMQSEEKDEQPTRTISSNSTVASSELNTDAGDTVRRHIRHNRIPGLLPTLRPYQTMAVEWMIERECCPTELNEWKLAWLVVSSSTGEVDDPQQQGRNNSTEQFVPLQQWEERQQTAQVSKGHDHILLFCPSVGWLATSVKQARDMSCGENLDVDDDDEDMNSSVEDDGSGRDNVDDDDDMSEKWVRGGILAESMGLGKTVEVLACILAHPRVEASTIKANDSMDSPVQIVVDDSRTMKLRGPTPTQQIEAMSDDKNDASIAKKKASVEEEMVVCGEIGETDDNDEDLDENVKEQTASLKSVNQSLRRKKDAVPVTPDFSRRQSGGTTTTETEERWLDEDETQLGSCLCGDVIHVGISTAIDPVVLCAHCKEPMHMDCAGFASLEELKRAAKPITYRKMFTDECWICYETPLATHQLYCPCCCAMQQRRRNSSSSARKKALIPSRATLIVTPPAILSQWEREIHRHAQDPNTESPLKVAIYHGVDKTTKSRPKTIRRRAANSVSSNGMKLLHPNYLADHDIILVTFDALLSDFGHVADENKFIHQDGTGGWLRRRKRYRVVPSPLSAIDFWRVCLDEAQRVERPTATSARMALKLNARHRWCVSGTPVGRGQLQDLYGLLLFLRMSPFSSKSFFTKSLELLTPTSLHHDKQRLHPIPMSYRIQLLLAKVFWRSTRMHPLVRQQMGVPEQREVKRLLKFSSVERYFYDKQLSATLATAGEFCERRRKGQKDKEKQTNLLAEHLHRLRAACCHPQVGAGGIANNTTGNLRHKRKSKNPKRNSTSNAEALLPSSEAPATSGAGVSNVLTMEEILVRLIDDARLKCEEAQRLVIMHTNAMAALSLLQVEASANGENFPKQDDEVLLERSCKLYVESLDLGEANSQPTPVLANAKVSGSKGFCNPNFQIHGGSKVRLDWRVVENDKLQTHWAKIEFEGPSRHITRFKLRPVTQLPNSYQNEVLEDNKWDIMAPKVYSVEVSSPALGGEFVPVAKLDCHEEQESEDNGWVLSHVGSHTHKSKSWRIVIESCHSNSMKSTSATMYYMGVELILEEAEIARDSLQTLHALHNASISFSALIQLREDRESKSENGTKKCSKVDTNLDGNDESNVLSVPSMKQRMKEMTTKAHHIESLYLQVAKSLHGACGQRLRDASNAREEAEKSILNLMPSLSNRKSIDCWDAGWWDEFLVVSHLYGEDSQAHDICVRVQEELDHIQFRTNSAVIKFPNFRDIRGLQMALQSRLNAIRSSGIGKATSWVNTIEDGVFQIRKDRFKCQPGMHGKCMNEIAHLSTSPTQHELHCNRHCHVCKADWNQQGPKCHHCVIGDQLNELEPDRITLLLMNTLHVLLRGPIGTSIIKKVVEHTGEHPNWLDRAKAFFDTLEAQKREKVLAWRQWRTHLDFLNDLDELNQCKESIRLAFEGEDLTELTSEQLNAVVLPCDVLSQYHDHAAKQGMAHGDLRRSKETLRYLRGQRQDQEQQHDHNASAMQEKTENNDKKEEHVEFCAVCLQPFGLADRAVLRCGHSFHASPCLERLKSRTNNISCPMRCRIMTSMEQVFIASDKRHDDGSSIQRHDVKGSWGTKVTQVVADLLDVRDSGEKAILFSQWEDMLDIVSQALIANGISYVRSSSRAKIGESLSTFRQSDDCTVLMLNVKHGAEGLTILEARHVLMLEPLLNHALDLQAINRVSRIGQTQQTIVHRYIIQDTVEVKIDAVRLACADEKLSVVEDTMSAKPSIRAGGIDGGLASEEELMQLLTLDQ